MTKSDRANAFEKLQIGLIAGALVCAWIACLVVIATAFYRVLF